MALSDKIAKTTGKITGKTFKIVKNAPTKTASKSKSLKDAFVDGVKSSSN
jgi:DNA-directed RNA polymerase subunit H (RpoH/RPB5)